jgi:hypothetical protein
MAIFFAMRLFFYNGASRPSHDHDEMRARSKSPFVFMISSRMSKTHTDQRLCILRGFLGASSCILSCCVAWSRIEYMYLCKVLYVLYVYCTMTCEVCQTEQPWYHGTHQHLFDSRTIYRMEAFGFGPTIEPSASHYFGLARR